MDPKEEYESFMRNLAFIRKIQASHKRAQAMHEEAKDNLLRATSAFNQADCNKMLAECLGRKR